MRRPVVDRGDRELLAGLQHELVDRQRRGLVVGREHALDRDVGERPPLHAARRQRLGRVRKGLGRQPFAGIGIEGLAAASERQQRTLAERFATLDRVLLRRLPGADQQDFAVADGREPARGRQVDRHRSAGERRRARATCRPRVHRAVGLTGQQVEGAAQDHRSGLDLADPQFRLCGRAPELDVAEPSRALDRRGGEGAAVGEREVAHLAPQVMLASARIWRARASDRRRRRRSSRASSSSSGSMSSTLIR